MNSYGHISVLLVDDEDIVCRVLTTALERKGYIVFVANDGAGGLCCFTEHRNELDLVISDIAMPDMSGPDMVKAIRDERPALGVLFISGLNEDLPDWATETCRLLRKPFTPAKFIGVVEDCLRSSRQSAA